MSTTDMQVPSPQEVAGKGSRRGQIGPHVCWGLPLLSELPLLWQPQNLSSYSSCITYERLCSESSGFFPCPHAILPEPGTPTRTTRGWGASGCKEEVCLLLLLNLGGHHPMVISPAGTGATRMGTLVFHHYCQLPHVLQFPSPGRGPCLSVFYQFLALLSLI